MSYIEFLCSYRKNDFKEMEVIGQVREREGERGGGDDW